MIYLGLPKTENVNTSLYHKQLDLQSTDIIYEIWKVEQQLLSLKKVILKDYLLGIFITRWSHWNYHYLTRGQPEGPSEEIKTYLMWIWELSSTRIAHFLVYCSVPFPETCKDHFQKPGFFSMSNKDWRKIQEHKKGKICN